MLELGSTLASAALCWLHGTRVNPPKMSAVDLSAAVASGLATALVPGDAIAVLQRVLRMCCEA